MLSCNTASFCATDNLIPLEYDKENGNNRNLTQIVYDDDGTAPRSSKSVVSSHTLTLIRLELPAAETLS
jgi:hypothetical protein